MIWTTGPSLTIALILYLILGFVNNTDTSAADTSTINLILDFIKENSKISLFLLIPPLFVICAVAFKLPAIPSLIGGVALGVPLMIVNGTPVTEIMNTLNNGYGVDAPEGADQMMTKLSSLLSTGGMQGMMWTISLILCAMAFGGIVDCTGIMGSLADVLLKVARGRGGLVFATLLSCIIINAICCDQYLSIILPGRMYKEAFEDMRLAPKNLSRCLEDSGTITSNLIPWNTCGATMRSFLQVDSGYVKFAFLNLINPFVSLFYGITGISMTKMTEEEYQKILENRKAEKEAALKALEA
jgi:NhaC family Na+:H+ antiporter